MKILVTGDKGFIGSALVKRLQAEKHEAVGIDTKAQANICLLYTSDAADE